MEDKGKKNISVELKDKKRNKKKDILIRIDELFHQIKENHQKEQEIESMFPIINNVQRRQFQYSKYRTEVLTCNKDNLILTKVLSSMPLYKQEKIYEFKKKGLKDFADKQFQKIRIKPLPQTILKQMGDSLVQQQTKIINEQRFQTENSIIYHNDSDKLTKSNLRMRNPDETLSFLKNNFGVFVNTSQKYRLRGRKELEQEEKQIERERRKFYNVKDKLEIYYTNIDTQISQKNKYEDPIKLYQTSPMIENTKSEEVSPTVDKEVRNNIFNRNLYYIDHYNSIKLGYKNEREKNMRSTNQKYNMNIMNDTYD
ncbi:unnamed protein product [Paramecium pentaurelia]|uniref:Uncharacterized protein n=1 Tax=Paramecium pentaurelia TaxID=43138 RepID=A0A8S1SJM2_9CILI|nr:unnamed protein product [Paramecium pentaurelia]